MTAVEKIKNELIDKILSIRNQDFLEALNKFISSDSSNVAKLTDEQITILQMSEEDIEKGHLISHEEMIKRNQEWLNGL